ncbi:hypothetical protein ACN28I_32235 [Archangium gephyra]|uniref:hypothetical protein n=1 Tax=Archangium gephyra TaxID=48 RepID=UPI003B7805FB
MPMKPTRPSGASLRPGGGPERGVLEHVRLAGGDLVAQEVGQLGGEDGEPSGGEIPGELHQPGLVDAVGVHARGEEHRAAPGVLGPEEAGAQGAVAGGNPHVLLGDGASAPAGDVPGQTILEASGAGHQGEAPKVIWGGEQHHEQQSSEEGQERRSAGAWAHRGPFKHNGPDPLAPSCPASLAPGRPY